MARGFWSSRIKLTISKKVKKISVRASNLPSLLPATFSFSLQVLLEGQLWLCLSGVTQQEQGLFGFQLEAAGIWGRDRVPEGSGHWEIPLQTGHRAQAPAASSQRPPREISDLRAVLLR